MQEVLATCRLQPITAYRPIDGISGLLAERDPDWRAWVVAPLISFQLVTVIYVAARRHIFVCFMAKSAFWRGFSALAPYTGVGPI